MKTIVIVNFLLGRKQGMIRFLLITAVFILTTSGVGAENAQGSSAERMAKPASMLVANPVYDWHTFLGGSDDDSGKSIAVDSSGNIYVTGSSDTTWGSPVRAFSGTDGTKSDVFVAKLTSSGSLLWMTFLGGAESDRGSGIAVNGAGEVYVVGYSWGTWGNPLSAFGGQLNTEDGFVAKLNNTGALAWNTFAGGDGIQYTDVALDPFGTPYISGFEKTPTGGPFAIKLGSGGAGQGKVSFGTPGDRAWAIAVDQSSNIYVAGESRLPWGTPTLPFTSQVSNAFAAKLVSGSGAGGIVLDWNAFIAGVEGGDNFGYGIDTDNLGNVYLAGGVPYLPGVSSPGLSAVSENNAFAAKFTGSGAWQWTKYMGGNDDVDLVADIAVNGSGNSYLTGFSGNTWGAPITGPCVFSCQTFVAQLDTSGVLQWHIFFDNAYFMLNTPSNNAIALDGTGNIVVTGNSRGQYFFSKSPVRAFSGGDSDSNVVKLSGGMIDLPYKMSIPLIMR